MDDQDIIFSIADMITKHNFKSIWDMEKHAMMGLKKEEIAEKMFFKGISYILNHLNTIDQIDISTIQKKIKDIT